MRPRRPLGDAEVFRDLPVRQSSRDTSEDVALAAGEARESVGLARPPVSAASRSHASRDDPRDGRVKMDLAGRRRADRDGELVGLRVLEQEAGRAGSIAATTRASSMKLVSAMTSSSGCAALIRAVASMPSRFGIIRSITTMSGRSSSARSTASAPSAASPTTSMSSCSARKSASTLTIAWSSTRRTRIGASGMGGV